jgi:hypothetical protein
MHLPAYWSNKNQKYKKLQQEVGARLPFMLCSYKNPGTCAAISLPTCARFPRPSRRANNIDLQTTTRRHKKTMGAFSVTKLSEGPVRPSAATPSETLPLAWVDRYPTHRGLVESAHVYRAAVAPQRPDHGAGDADDDQADATTEAAKKQSKSPAAVVRGALADALVHYYPFAGRIVEGDAPGRPAVWCSAEGVYFVEAAANCTLADVNYLERPLLLAKEDLVPCPTSELWPVEPHNSLAMIQVYILL